MMPIAIDRDRLVDLAIRLVSTPSFTGSEEACAAVMREVLAEAIESRGSSVSNYVDAEGKRAAGLDHPRSGELVALAAPDRWFTYYYWLDDARAPEFARTVDIHRKPGYDPVELFLDPTLTLPPVQVGWRLAKKMLGFRMLMDVIPLDPSLVRGANPAVGGGFGAKAGFIVEYQLVAKAALELNRPVKWTETRSENMVAMWHGRGMVHDVELGLKRDGTITGLKVFTNAEAGAYAAIGAFLPFFTQMMASNASTVPSRNSMPFSLRRAMPTRGITAPPRNTFRKLELSVGCISMGSESGACSP